MALTKVSYSMIDGAVANVLDFGAVGDGSNNDTTAIQAAIDSGATAVFFPQGTYKITATLNITSKMLIQGAKAKIDASTSNFYALNITASDVTVDGLEIEGAGNSVYNTNGRLIAATGTDNGAGNAPTYISNIAILNCNLHDAGRGGVYAAFVDNLKVINNVVKDVGYSGIQCFSVKNSLIDGNIVDTVSPGVLVGSSYQAYGIEANRTSSADLTQYPQCDNIVVSSNTVSNVPTWEGLDTHGGTNIKFIGNTVTGCNTGVAIVRSVDGGGAQVVATSDIVVADNTIKNCTRAAVSAGAASPAHANFSVANNITDDCGPSTNEDFGAFRLFNITNLSVTGNVASNNRRNAFLFQGVTYSSVTGNVVQNVYSDDIVSPSGFMLNAGCEHISIQGNTLDATAVAPYTGTYNNVYGLDFDSSISLQDLMVANNDFSQATNRAYGAATDYTVVNNPPTFFRGRETFAVTTGVSTLTQTVTIPGPYYTGAATFDVVASLRSIATGVQGVVVEALPTDYNTVSIKVRSADGANFAANGNVVVSWLAFGW
jgi:nitrous oxidase accessory protein NosD